MAVIELRRASEEDLGVVASWIRSGAESERWAGWRVAFPIDLPALPSALEWATSESLVACVDGEVAAFGQLVAKPAGRQHLARLIADPARRGQGLGRRLAAHLLVLARALGASAVSLNVAADNREALGLYHSLGFAPAARPEDEPASESRYLELSGEPAPGPRTLFTFVGGRGHLEPLLPIAAAARTAGHEVAFGCGPGMVADVEAAGFRVFAMGDARPAPVRRLPLRAPDPAREDRDLRERFARVAARHRAPLARELVRAFDADLLVCDETDFGAMVAAEALGVPHADVQVIASGAFVRPELVAEPLDALRAEHGLAPDPGLAMPGRHLLLAPFPPRFRDPASPAPATTRWIRPGASVASRAERGDGTPRVYVTLGTVFNTESGDLLARLVDALREAPLELVATTGAALDPEALGPQPGNVRVERYLPQAALLPTCDLVVCHGGSGSVMGALAHGLPAVLLPLGADQPHNAARCAALGVARVLDPMAVDAGAIREAVLAVLADPEMRRRAAALGEEIAALPGPEHAVAQLEALLARAVR